jgi:HEAT repeat protein
LRNICWSVDRARAAAFNAGAIPVLIGLLGHESDRVKDAAAFTLWMVSQLEPASTAAQHGGAITILVKLLDTDDNGLQRSVMVALCATTDGEVARPAKIEALEANCMKAVVRLIDAGRTDIYEAGAALIRSITFLEEVELSAGVGAIPALVKLLSSSDVYVLQLRGLEEYLL